MGMGVVLVLKIRNEISGLLLWVEVKMVKNKIYFFGILFCPLVKVLACCQVSTKKMAADFFSPSAVVVLKEVILGLSINKCFVLKSTKNQSITNILTASVVLRMIIDSLLSNQWWIFPVKKFRD